MKRQGQVVREIHKAVVDLLGDDRTSRIVRGWLPQPCEELMRKRRFSEDETVRILREADNAPLAEVVWKHGIAEQTIDVWRRRFGRLEPAAAPGGDAGDRSR